MKVLIIDDNQDLAESLGEVLEENHEVTTCFSSSRGLELFKTQKFDIAFLDVKMPGMNGVDLFLEMKKIQSDVKVVLMTGYSLQDLLDKATENGVFGIIHKPLEVQTLFDYMDKVNNAGVVLLVDDDDDFSSSIQEVLEYNNYSVELARSGEEAIKVLENKSFNLLLLDLRLPNMDGFQVIKKLSSNGKLLPTIILSAYVNDYDAEIRSLSKEKQVKCISKAVDVDDLIDEIKRVSTN